MKVTYEEEKYEHIPFSEFVKDKNLTIYCSKGTGAYYTGSLFYTSYIYDLIINELVPVGRGNSIIESIIDLINKLNYALASKYIYLDNKAWEEITNSIEVLTIEESNSIIEKGLS